MKVLLNATARDLDKVSGDVSYYRDLLASDTSGDWEYQLVSPRVETLRQFPKILERACNYLPASTLRRELFVRARQRAVTFRGDPVRADVILSHIVTPVPDPAGPPVIWSSQGLSPPDYYEKASPVPYRDVVHLYEEASRHVAALLIWTESGARRLRQEANLSAPIVVLPPVLPRTAGKEALPRTEETRLLFVGRDAERKGLPELVAALQTLSKGTVGLRFDIVSAPDAQLESKIQSLGFAKLHRNPSDERVAELMSSADLLAIPTKAETYGYVLVEAMAHGCALLTSDSPPMNELASEGVNGTVVPQGNVEALTEALRRLLDDPEGLRRMGRASRQRYLTEFAPEVAIPRYHSLFEAVARRKPLEEFSK